jgi:spermidine/putrescine transport system substrate-binding protein
MKKRIFALALSALMLLGLAFGLTGCTGGDGGLSNLNLVSEYTRDLAGTTLNIVNWGEFIAEGQGPCGLHIVQAFQALTGIRVNYTNFNTNEELHLWLTSGGASYDLTFPSDYMIQRLIAEDELNAINFDNIPNFRFIEEDFQSGLWFDPASRYSVPYVWGMTGIIYNSALVDEPPTSWTALWDERYAGQILQFESSRDAFALAHFVLGHDINTTDPADWEAAADLLKQQAPLVQAYVADQIYDIMIGDNAILAPYYAGDFMYMAEYNEDLRFVYPTEGVNFFVDSMVIPRSARNQAAAEMFINFLLEPDVALANATAVYYAFPHTQVIGNADFVRQGDPVLFPAEMPPNQRFEHLPAEIISLKNRLWNEVRMTR